jgi:hypothetical protein
MILGDGEAVDEAVAVRNKGGHHFRILVSSSGPPTNHLIYPTNRGGILKK